MTTLELVSVERKEGIAIVSMQRIDRRNALSVALREELITALAPLVGESDACRVIILTGAGGHFCAGGDLEDFVLPDVEAGRMRMRRAHVLPRMIAAGPKPFVAAIEGSAFGAGLSLAMACDHVIATEDARFCASFVKVGLMPDYGLLWSLPRRIGHARANEMLMQATEVSGRAAAQMGMINEACAKGEALARALIVAERLSRLAPLALAAIKQVQGAATDLENVFRGEIEAQARLFKSEDFQEAIQAFRNRRQPNFEGR